LDPPSLLAAALQEAASLVNDGDLLVTALSLRFATAALAQQPACAPAVCERVLPQAIALVKSPLLQGEGQGRGGAGRGASDQHWQRGLAMLGAQLLLPFGALAPHLN
jgi:hypothetical protein